MAVGRLHAVCARPGPAPDRVGLVGLNGMPVIKFKFVPEDKKQIGPVARGWIVLNQI